MNDDGTYQPYSYFQLMEVSLRELLVEKGIVTEAQVAATVNHFRNADTLSLILKGAPLRLGREGLKFTLSAQDIQALDIWAASNPRVKAAADTAMEHYNGPIGGSLRKWMRERFGYSWVVDNYSPRPRERTAGDAPDEPTNFSVKSLLKADILHERKGGTKRAIIIEDIFEQYSNHSWKVAHIVGLERALTKARKIFESKKIADAATRRGMERSVRHVDQFLKDMTGEALGILDAPGEGFVRHAASWFRGTIPRGLLGLNVPSAAAQVGGYVLLSRQLPKSEILRSISKRSPFRFSMDAEIHRHSPMLRARMSGARLGLASEGATNTGHGAYGIPETGHIVLGMHAAVDNGIIRAAWDVSKRMVEREMPDATEDARMRRVAEMAEESVFETQPSWDTLHRSGIAREATRNPLAGLLTMLSSATNINFNLIAQDGIRFHRDRTAGNAARVAKTAAAVWISGALIRAAIYQMFDEAKQSAGMESDGIGFRDRLISVSFGDAASLVHLGAPFGALASPLMDNKKAAPRTSFSPAVDLMESAIHATRDIASNIDPTDSDFWNSVGRLASSAGPLFGIPAWPVRQLTELATGRGGGGKRTAGYRRRNSALAGTGRRKTKRRSRQ